MRKVQCDGGRKEVHPPPPWCSQMRTLCHGPLTAALDPPLVGRGPFLLTGGQGALDQKYLITDPLVQDRDLRFFLEHRGPSDQGCQGPDKVPDPIRGSVPEVPL